MNQQLQNYARNYLKVNLAALPENNQQVFKLMYGRQGGKRSLADAESMHVAAVVDEIPAEKLDWAMQQVERTLTANRSNDK